MSCLWFDGIQQFLLQRSIIRSLNCGAFCQKLHHQYSAIAPKDCEHHHVCWGLGTNILWRYSTIMLSLFSTGLQFQNHCDTFPKASGSNWFLSTPEKEWAFEKFITQTFTVCANSREWFFFPQTLQLSSLLDLFEEYLCSNLPRNQFPFSGRCRH